MSKHEKILTKLLWDMGSFGVARVYKIPESLRNTPCDYMGFTSTGRAVLIEAKDVSRSALPTGDSPGLSSFQWASLVEANRAGALALISWKRGNEIAVLSMDMATELSAGRNSIPWALIPLRFIRQMKDHPHSFLSPFLEIP